MSPVQKAQMITAPYSRLKVLSVPSDFDFCQTSIKKIFNDKEFNDKLKKEDNVCLSAANSINWGRLLPQVCYHVFGYLKLAQLKKINIGDKIHMCVPTGNFGNILAGLLAKESGVPYDRLISASNDNNVLSDFFINGVYDIQNRNLIKTSSPSIDILKSSNLERMLHVITQGKQKSEIASYFADLDAKKKFIVSEEIRNKLKQYFDASWCDDITAKKIISETISKTQGTERQTILIDPHTAVAVHVMNEFVNKHGNNIPIIVASTAHYAKFPNAIFESMNISAKVFFINLFSSKLYWIVH